MQYTYSARTVDVNYIAGVDAGVSFTQLTFLKIYIFFDIIIELINRSERKTCFNCYLQADLGPNILSFLYWKVSLQQRQSRFPFTQKAKTSSISTCQEKTVWKEGGSAGRIVRN